MSENAAPPSRWQLAQRLYTTREISCVHVSLVVIGSWARAAAAPIRPAIRMYRLIAARLFFVFLLRKQVLQRHFCVKRHVEEAEHHLIPALIAPRDFLG